MANMTLKNLPPRLHARLKSAARRNRRSLNSEIIARLEGLPAPTIDTGDYRHDLAAFTAALPKLNSRRITEFKRRGRA